MSTLIKSITLEEFLQHPETEPASEYKRVELLTGRDSLPILSKIDLSLTVEQVFSWLTL